MKHFVICFLLLVSNQYATSQNLPAWVDTLQSVYPNQIKILDQSPKAIEVNITSLPQEHVEDIAQYIRKHAQNFYLKHYYFWHNEMIYDARQDASFNVEKIPEYLQKNKPGIYLALKHTQVNIIYKYDFKGIKEMKYVGSSVHNFTVSGVSSTDYEKQTFTLKCDLPEKNKLNSLLSYLNYHYNTGIPTFENIPGLYEIPYTLSKGINPDSTLTFEYSIMTRNINKEDLRRHDFSNIISQLTPVVILGAGLYGLKKLYDYSTYTPDYYPSNTNTYHKNSDQNAKIEVAFGEWEKTPTFGNSGTADPERKQIKFKCPGYSTNTFYIGRNLEYHSSNPYSTGTNVCGFGGKRTKSFEEAVTATIECTCNGL
ncbi:MAG: hypothetical protein IT269_08875 [Saprospiraceae bacterium]|nr:hypothetical protein [Saprospiraceae bacterium]